MRETKGSGYLVKNFLKHNVIFSEGSKGEHAYVLTQGRVEISGTVSGRKKVFAVLKPISIFGEMAIFLENQQRTATAMALEDCKAVVMNKYDLDKFIESSPPIISTIMNVLVHRLKTATQKALMCPNIPMGICRVFDMFGANGLMEIGYEHAVRSLSETFVVTPEQVEQYLAGLVQKKLIAIHLDPEGRRTIHLLSADFLNSVFTRMRDDAF